MGFYGHNDGTVEHVRTKLVRWSDRPKKFELIKCPSCGSDRADLWYVGAGNGGWRVICTDCLHLPDRLCKTEQEAVDLWNGVIT